MFVVDVLEMEQRDGLSTHCGVWRESCLVLCEERPRLPHAGHGRLQPAPLAPPQGTAGPLNRTGGASLNVYMREGKNTVRDGDQ